MWEYRKPDRLLFVGGVQKWQPNQEALKWMKTNSEMKLFQKKKAPVLSSRYIDPDVHHRNCLSQINSHGRRWAHISTHKSLEPYQKSAVLSHSRRSQLSSFEVSDQVKQWCQVARFRALWVVASGSHVLNQAGAAGFAAVASVFSLEPR